MRLAPGSLAVYLTTALLLAIAARPAIAETRSTLKVIDGDTIELDGRTFRLYGIDAPELGQTCLIRERPYDCGAVARAALLDLTAGATVTCETAPPTPGHAAGDGRSGICNARGYDLSEGMTYTGWALALRRVSDRYLIFEERARAARRGLWKGRFDTPWNRHGGMLPRGQDSAD